MIGVYRMKKLVALLVLFRCTVVGAEIVYMKGSVYYAQALGSREPNGGPYELFLNIDSQLDQEIFPGGEYPEEFYPVEHHGGDFYIDMDQEVPITSGTSLRPFSLYGGGVAEAESSDYSYLGITYNNPNFVTSERYFKFYLNDANMDRYYGWLLWDGTTFSKYAFESIPNKPIAIGAIPEPSSIAMIGLACACAACVRRWIGR